MYLPISLVSSLHDGECFLHVIIIIIFKHKSLKPLCLWGLETETSTESLVHHFPTIVLRVPC